VPPSSLAALGGVEPDAAGILLRVLEESELVARGYDLWAEVEVRHLDEEPGDMRDELRAVHAALPGSGNVRIPELARRAGLRPVVVQGALYRMIVDGVIEAIPRGSLVDVRIKGSLDMGTRRAIAARLKRQTNAAYDQIRDVETYANLTTCRRERLLRHFGDTEEVAPCGGCDVCLGEASSMEDLEPAMRTASPIAALIDYEPNGTSDVDPELFERLRAWRGEQARAQHVPAYVVLHNSHLEEIASRKPRTIHELGSIKGIGLRRAARYGDELLALVGGEAPVPPSRDEPDVSSNGEDYRAYLETAEALLRDGRGAEAVPELARALAAGGDAARAAVDRLLAGSSRTENGGNA
jgi:hypothetical protein